MVILSLKGGNLFKIEMHYSRVGRVLQCFLSEGEEIGFDLPRGQGLLEGWKFLAAILRSLWVVPPHKTMQEAKMVKILF